MTTKTKDGGTFNIINLYQFTADKADDREQIWKIISDWISKHPSERTILVGDFNCSGQGDQWGYVLPLHKSLTSADKKLRDFCEASGGLLVSPPGHTWSRDGHKAVLDHAVTWNMTITSPKVDHPGESHKNYDHGRTSFGLPPEDFLRRSTPARDFAFLADKVDVIHFHSNLSEWQRRVGDRISPFALEVPAADGDDLMQRLTEDQEVLRKEALNMQLKEAKSRRRAKERLPGRNKEQTKVRREHSIFAAAYGDAMRQKSHDGVTTATKMDMDLLDLSFSDKAMQIIRGMKDWVETLRNELRKKRNALNVLAQKQLRGEKSRRSGYKKYIFEHGIKGVRRVMRKHGTVSSLQQVE